MGSRSSFVVVEVGWRGGEGVGGQVALLDGDDGSGLGDGSTFSSASWIGYLAERRLGGELEGRRRVLGYQ